MGPRWDTTYHSLHDDVIKWKHFLHYWPFVCYWPFVRGIHRSPVNSPHKGQWHGALMFSVICTWMNYWVNNHEAGDLRHHCAHYDVTVMGEPHEMCYLRSQLVTIMSWNLKSPAISVFIQQSVQTIDKETIKTLLAICKEKLLVTGKFPWFWTSWVEMFSCHGVIMLTMVGNSLALAITFALLADCMQFHDKTSSTTSILGPSKLTSVYVSSIH